MNIQSLGNSATYYYTTTQKNKDNFEEVLVNTNVKIEDEKESLTVNVYEQLASKYDVRNATFEELREIAQSLYDAGEITGKEVASLTFDYERATNYIKQNVKNTYVSPNFSFYETEENENGKKDWIAEFEARASKSFQYGDLVGYQNNSKILNILQKLQHSEPQVITHFDDIRKSELKIEEAQKIVAQQEVENSQKKQSPFPDDAPQAVHDYYNSLPLEEKSSIFIATVIQRDKDNAYQDNNGQWHFNRPEDPHYVDIFKLPGFTYTKLADAMLDDLEFQHKFMDVDQYKEKLEILKKFKLAVEGY